MLAASLASCGIEAPCQAYSGEVRTPPSSTDRFCAPARIWSTRGMQAFNLVELHDCWELLKARGRVAIDAMPPAVQNALKELGLAEVDGTDIVLR